MPMDQCAKFVKPGRYAHVNDPVSPQFTVSEEEAAKGKVIGGLSQLTVDSYVKLGYCEALGDDPEEVAEPETEAGPTVLGTESMTRKRGRRGALSKE